MSSCAMAGTEVQNSAEVSVLVVLFLCDGTISVLELYKPPEELQSVEWGDLVSDTRNGKEETAVVLGFGTTETEARRSSKEYFRRLAKWDNVPEATQYAVEVFGYDLSQSQYFQDMD